MKRFMSSEARMRMGQSIQWHPHLVEHLIRPPLRALLHLKVRRYTEQLSQAQFSDFHLLASRRLQLLIGESAIPV